jgi:predicted Ser/Thr protein kinase
MPATGDPLRLRRVADKLVVGGQLGNYLIESVIGRGGMSVVYGAKHARLGMSVALKVLAPELSSDDTFRERFLREAQIAAGLDHQNVIPILDMGLHEDSLYIVMRYVAGGDLKTVLNTSGPLEAQQALKVLVPVAMALDAAHAHGLVHRDVKPANILLQRSSAGAIEHVYLTDFGIAKSAAFSGGLTGAGASIGTVGYMAPEQLEGREVTAQTDVYALAVTLYECLAGRIPFQRELAEGIHPPTGALEPVSRVRPDLPSELDGAIARGLSRDLQSRYPTCESFLATCRAAIDSQPASQSEVAPSAVAGVGVTAVSAAQPTEAVPAIPSQPPAIAAEPIAASVPAAATAGERDAKTHSPGGKRALLGGLAAAAVAAVVVVVIILGSSGSSAPKGAPSDAALAEVPTNHVTGSGAATVHLSGDSAAITVTTSGLDNGAELVHLMHIHAGGKGQCPPASSARLHNNHLSISTNDGINYYGPPVQALTTHGDTGVASILAFPRFLSGGNLHYSRTIVLPPKVAAAIRDENALIVVHGTDYDGTGIYSGVLDASELSKSVPATATAPALCGRLVPAENADAAGPGSADRTQRYTASLIVNTAPGAQAGAFVCHVGGATGPVQDSERRRASA